MTAQNRPRIASIDLFRGLTMFFMLWVNSFWSLSDVPHWLQHAARGEDMLGFSDLLFPAFLFIMGVSVPLAIDRRRAKGDSKARIVVHVLARTVALLAMGLWTVNFGDAYSAAGTGLSRSGYALWMVLAFFLVWNAYPASAKSRNRIGQRCLQAVGIGLLLWLAIRFRGNDGSMFSIRWWGILGRIGWTYLFCATIYLLLGKRLWATVGVAALTVAGALIQAWGIVPGDLLPNSLTIYAFGSTGLVLSLLIERNAGAPRPDRLYRICLATGLGMLLAGLAAHTQWIVSKLAATPTWYFYCCALFFPLFALLHYLSDVRGCRKCFAWVAPAGTLALGCYVFAYAWNPLKNLVFSDPLLRPEFSVGIPGLVNSFVYAMLLIWTVHLLSRAGIRLKV